MPQQPSQSQPVKLAPVIQPATIPPPAHEVSVPDPDFDCNNPAIPVLQHVTTAKGPSKKRVFDKKEQRDEVLQPYLDKFVNSDEQKGAIFNAGKHSDLTSNKLPLKSQHSHKRISTPRKDQSYTSPHGRPPTLPSYVKQEHLVT